MRHRGSRARPDARVMWLLELNLQLSDEPGNGHRARIDRHYPDGRFGSERHDGSPARPICVRSIVNCAKAPEPEGAAPPRVCSIATATRCSPTPFRA